MDLLAVQGTLKSLLQHRSLKASILWCSAFFIAQLSHPYMTTGKTIALTRWIFVDKVMSLLFNMLSRLVITFLSRSKHLLISWLHSPSAVILEPPKIVCYCFHCFPIYLQGSDRTLKVKLPRSVGAQYATGDQWRNNSEGVKRQSQSKNNTQLCGGSTTGDGSKVRCCKESIA